MAKFTTYYNLAPINDTKEFLGISKDKVNGNIITTIEKNCVVVLKVIIISIVVRTLFLFLIFQISSQKQIRSWNSFDKLSSKVLYDPKSKQYVGVFGQRSIRCWDENTSDLNKVKKISFHRNIGSLVQNGDDGELLVLYSSGETESLSSAINNRKCGSEESISQTLPSTIEANIFSPEDGSKVLTFFEKNAGVLSLGVSFLDSDTLKTVSSCKYSISRGDIPLSGYCIVASGNLFEFISICE